jgi:hypothetical protein
MARNSGDTLLVSIEQELKRGFHSWYTSIINAVDGDRTQTYFSTARQFDDRGFLGSKRHTTKSVWVVRSSLDEEASTSVCQLQLER